MKSVLETGDAGAEEARFDRNGAGRTVLYPPYRGALGHFSLSSRTGQLAFTMAAGAALFSMRWTHATYKALILRVAAAAAISEVISTAVVTGVDVSVVRKFTASDSGGTSLNNANAGTITNRLRSSYGGSLFGDIRIAATAALTGGTRTLDSAPLAETIFGSGTVVGTTPLVLTELFKINPAYPQPIVLSQDEGILGELTLAGPGSGSFRVAWVVEWLEVPEFDL